MFPEVEVIRIDFECITAIEMDYVRVGSIAFRNLYQMYYITKSWSENGTKKLRENGNGKPNGRCSS